VEQRFNGKKFGEKLASNMLPRSLKRGEDLLSKRQKVEGIPSAVCFGFSKVPGTLSIQGMADKKIGATIALSAPLMFGGTYGYFLSSRLMASGVLDHETGRKRGGVPLERHRKKRWKKPDG